MPGTKRILIEVSAEDYDEILFNAVAGNSMSIIDSGASYSFDVAFTPREMFDARLLSLIKLEMVPVCQICWEEVSQGVYDESK
jgi:hypothetical protein